MIQKYRLMNFLYIEDIINSKTVPTSASVNANLQHFFPEKEAFWNCVTQVYWVALSSVVWLVGWLSRCPALVTSPLYDGLDHTNHIFSESTWSKDIKTDIAKCLIHKYTNTNTQIHKYTNKAHDKVPERPNMLYIFEKRIVQGYQKWYFH